MAQSANELVAAAYDAYARGRRNEQAALTGQALGLEPSLHEAAVLHFLAYWQGGNPKHAAKFILDYANRQGTTIRVLFCLILALMEIDAPAASIIEKARIWLDNLSGDDIRAVLHRQKDRELRVLTTAALASRSTEVGATIAERFGVLGAVKSMSPKDMGTRWRQPSFHLVRDIRVVPGSWILHDDNNVYMNETASWPQKLKEPRLFLGPMSAVILAMTDRSALLNLPTRTREIDRPCVLLGSDLNFYRFLTDNIARLASIDGKDDVRNFSYLVDANLPQLHFDCFEKLGIARDRLIFCGPDDSILCRELLVPTLLSSIEVVHPAGIEWVRKALGPDSRDASFPRRILVSRSKAHRRKFVNEDQVFDRLQPLGFTKVTPDALGFADQVRAFQNADIVVAPFGTCLTGIMFAPRTCAIFEIIDEQSIPVHRYIENVAIHLGQSFHCFLSSKIKKQWSFSTAEHDFEVDADDLIAKLAPYL